MKVKKLVPHAIIPTKANPTDAGYDLYAAEDVVVHPVKDARDPITDVGHKCYELVKTGIAVRFDNGVWGQIEGRSGLALKKGILIGAGIIDNSYTGEIGVMIFNMGNHDFVIKQGDKIAQLILRPQIDLLDGFEVTDDLGETDRGAKGFGSSGTR